MSKRAVPPFLGYTVIYEWGLSLSSPSTITLSL
jgi:hypothetical protein